MEIIEDIREMQKFSDSLRADGRRIGFVPTMGYLHEGHLSLMRRAKELSDVSVISIFVNPTQFAPGEDYDMYPRNPGRDKKLAENVGVDIIFQPPAEQMYLTGYRSFVEVEKITKVLCGRSRPTHFRGVTTVVAKLFNIVKPHVAVFGQKDAQQAIVIKRMAKDLNFDVEIVVAPTVREGDGLAMSSRNEYLSPEEREQATVLYKSLCLADELYKNGERDAEKIKRAMHKLIEDAPSAKIDYIELVDSEELQPVNKINSGTLVTIAVKIGKTRLIDNSILGGEQIF